MTISLQTVWVDWADADAKVEMRKARPVNPKKEADFWKRSGMPFLVVNTIDDFARWYFSGGHALVETTIAEKLLPKVTHPGPCVQIGSRGFTSIPSLDDLPRTLFRQAPTPKLRMAILKRDGYRCRRCGRRPENNVDIQLDVHHIRPVGKRGATHEDNLITLCDTCHNGLNPHYDWSLYDLLEDQTTDAVSHARQKYLRGVEAYRNAIRTLSSEPKDGTKRPPPPSARLPQL